MPCDREFEYVSEGHWWDRTLKQHQLEKQAMLEVYSSACVLGLAWRCLKLWILCPDIIWVPMYHVQASGRGRDFWRGEVPGGHFPLQNLHGEAEGVMAPWMQTQGTLYARAWGSGRHTGQGVKKSVSSKSGRWDRDRDVWSRLQAEGSAVQFEKALSQGRQICLRAGALF